MHFCKINKTKQPILNIRCWNDSITGFGNMAKEVNEKLSSKIKINAQLISQPHLGEIELLMDVLPNASNIVQYKSIFLSMWESSIIPDKIIPHLNKAKMLIVPSNYNKQVFTYSGVMRPIAVVPLGVNTDIYHNKYTSKNETCVFGVAGTPTYRKNIPFVVNTFKKAFEGKNAILKLKTSLNPEFDMAITYHPQIKVITQCLIENEMCNWYNSLDAFVSCTHSEGFGLHQLEAMSCGVPVISPKFGGITEFFDETVGYCVDYELAATGIDFFPGVWSFATEESLIEKMMAVYNNRQQAIKIGIKAKEKASLFTWEQTATKLANILSDYIQVFTFSESVPLHNRC